MIFVTVGTHEQAFDRLVKEIDNLKQKGTINEEVFIQTGYSEYIPKNCEFKKIISYDEMVKLTKEARIIITHGGPGSIFLPINFGKKPIVVPRNPKFNEHVDDHQIKFSKRMYENGRVDLVLNINELESNILTYRNYDKNKIIKDDNDFISKFEKIVDELVKYE